MDILKNLMLQEGRHKIYVTKYVGPIASKSKLLLEEIDDKLVITIEDNGIGFDSKNISISNGFGITQIRARIKNMQGDMRIKSKIGQGTTISIKIILLNTV